jgi:hypothetical protein
VNSSFPGKLDTVGPSTDIDVIDHEQDSAGGSSQVRSRTEKIRLRPGQPAVDDLGLPRVRFPRVDFVRDLPDLVAGLGSLADPALTCAGRRRCARGSPTTRRGRQPRRPLGWGPDGIDFGEPDTRAGEDDPRSFWKPVLDLGAPAHHRVVRFFWEWAVSQLAERFEAPPGAGASRRRWQTGWPCSSSSRPRKGSLSAEYDLNQTASRLARTSAGVPATSDATPATVKDTSPGKRPESRASWQPHHTSGHLEQTTASERGTRLDLLERLAHGVLHLASCP